MKDWELVKTCGKQLDKDEIVYKFVKIKIIVIDLDLDLGSL